MTARCIDPNTGKFYVEGPTPEMIQEAVEEVEGVLHGAATFTRSMPVALTLFTKDGAQKDALADTAGSSLLGLADANGSPLLGTAANNTHPVEKAIVPVRIPIDYKAGTNLTVRVRAKLAGAVAVAGKVGVEAFKFADGALGSDIGDGAPQTVAGTNAYITKDFTITGTTLSPGDLVWLRLTCDNDDTAGSANKAMSVGQVDVRYTGVGFFSQ